ncbi:MAG: sugar kinase [Armatimonadota bacterium]|jgi:sugar/nucleoside kinase (ribokinase family)
MASIDILSIGEFIVDVLRKELDTPLGVPAEFIGPFPSGAPANFVCQAARLGAKTGFIGAVGDDDFGEANLELFAADGIDTTYVHRHPELSTGVAFVTYFSDGNRRFLFHIGNSAAAQMPLPPREYVEGVKWLHICGSTLSASEAMRERCYQVCEMAADAGGRVSFDPNLRPELLGGEEAVRQVCRPILEHTALVLPSASEAEVLADISEPVGACKALLEGPAEVVVLKRGTEGCTVITEEDRIDVGPFTVEAVDPTGAGDCFDAAFVVGLLEGLPLDECGRLANACGALGASRHGPMEGALPRAQVEAFMASQ